MATDSAGVGTLYAAIFLLGVAETAYENASRAILPALVPRGRLEAANGQLQGAELVAQSFVGPPLGGVLFAAAAAAPFFSQLGGVVIAAALLASLRGTFRSLADPDSGVRAHGLRGEIAEGVRFLRGDRLLRSLAFSSALAAFLGQAVMGILVLYALEELGLDERGFGF